MMGIMPDTFSTFLRTHKSGCVKSQVSNVKGMFICRSLYIHRLSLLKTSFLKMIPSNQTVELAACCFKCISRALPSTSAVSKRSAIASEAVCEITGFEKA